MTRTLPVTRRAFTVALGATMFSPSLFAQSYPVRPVRWVVGYPPGGANDTLARTVAAALSTAWGQQVFVENKSGAGGMLAAQAVARAEPDGYTVMTAGVAILALNPAVYPTVPYDPVTDFASVGMISRFPLLIAANRASGIKSIQQLISDSKRGTGINYGSAGIGTPHHVAMELLLSTTAATAQHVPYKGDAPVLQGLVGGELPVAIVAPSISLPFVRDGSLVPLAVTSDSRMPQLPEVPTLKELAYAPMGVYAWQGLVVPKRTPAPVVEVLSKQLRRVVELPAVRQRLAELGMEAIGSDAAEMDRYVQEQIAFWGKLISSRGIRAS